MTTALQSLAQRQLHAFTTAQAHECGYSIEEIRHAVRSKQWLTLRRGRYVERDIWDGLEAVQRVETRASAVLLGFRTTVAAVSHRTAATLWGLPVGPADRRPIEVTTASGRPRRAEGLVVHAHRLPSRELALHAGWLMFTSVARTVADCLRTFDTESAVVLADAALFKQLVSPAEVRECLGDPPRPGSRAAERVLLATDARSESPGESRARLQIEAAFPGRFASQVRVLGSSGRSYRLDFADVGRKVAGEYDGREKYATRDDLIAEKLREDDLRAVGWQFFRLTAADLVIPGRVASIVARAVALALHAA